jgi:hypothetical protein
VLIFGTSKTKRTRGPDIRVDCLWCGEQGASAITFTTEEHIRLYGLIPVPAQRETHVVCETCGADRLTRLTFEELAAGQPGVIADQLYDRVSVIAKALAVLAALLFCLPFVGLGLGIAGLVADRRARGWPFRLSALAVAAHVLLWGGLLLRSAMAELNRQNRQMGQ